MSYVIKDKNSPNYFVNPTLWSWDFTKDKSKATVFDSLEIANNVVDNVNFAIYTTFWDWDDIVPEAEVQPL
jgi:hypothetical protein